MNRRSKPSDQIIAEVTSWPGVEARPDLRGGYAFTIGDCEIGHLHGDYTAHFYFPKSLWDGLREQERIMAHPFFPLSRGPAARDLESDADVREVIALMRLNYERMIGLTTFYGGIGAAESKVA
ncbi:MAG: luciferase family protein [Gemmatimonadaceae bacterium]